MSPQLSLLFDGKKFMWDGRVHSNSEEATALKQEYERGNFEVRVVEDDGTFFVYTRRVVQSVAAVQ